MGLSFQAIRVQAHTFVTALTTYVSRFSVMQMQISRCQAGKQAASLALASRGSAVILRSLRHGQKNGEWWKISKVLRTQTFKGSTACSAAVRLKL